MYSLGKFELLFFDTISDFDRSTKHNQNTLSDSPTLYTNSETLNSTFQHMSSLAPASTTSVPAKNRRTAKKHVIRWQEKKEGPAHLFQIPSQPDDILDQHDGTIGETHFVFAQTNSSRPIILQAKDFKKLSERVPVYRQVYAGDDDDTSSVEVLVLEVEEVGIAGTLGETAKEVSENYHWSLLQEVTRTSEIV